MDDAVILFEVGDAVLVVGGNGPRTAGVSVDIDPENACVVGRPG